MIVVGIILDKGVVWIIVNYVYVNSVVGVIWVVGKFYVVYLYIEVVDEDWIYFDDIVIGIGYGWDVLLIGIEFVNVCFYVVVVLVDCILRCVVRDVYGNLFIVIVFCGMLVVGCLDLKWCWVWNGNCCSGFIIE